MKLKKIGLLFISGFFVLSLFVFTQASQTELINWRELVPFLIDIPNWTAEGDAEGSSVSMGTFSVSQAEREYTSGDSRMKIQIIDSGANQMAFAAYKMAMAFEVDTSDEYIKKVEIKGFPGFEHYKYADKEGIVHLSIEDRFLVQLEGGQFDDCGPLKTAAESLDLAGLAKLIKK